MESIVISSENLITNRKVRDMIGYGNLADSCKETLTIIKEGLKQVDNPKNDSLKDSAVSGTEHNYRSVGPFEDEIPQIRNNASPTNGDEATNQTQSDGNSLQLNVKLFLREYNREVALEAINYIVARLSTTHIDNLYVTVPANVIAHIGLTSHSSDTEAGSTSESEAGTPSQEASKLAELDPERTKYAEVMINLWNTLSKMQSIESLGLCDVETDVFKKIYNEVQIKPKNVQINLKSCCVVPPELKEFANVNNIKLLTHSDSPEILGDSFCSQINEGTDKETGNQKWKPLWIIRFQVFKKMRGVLEDKRYIIALEKDP